MKKISLAILAFSGLFMASAALAAAPTADIQPTSIQAVAASSSQAGQAVQPGWMTGTSGRPNRPSYGMMNAARPMMDSGRSVNANGRESHQNHGMMIVGLVVSSITVLLLWAFLISAIMALCQWNKKQKALAQQK